MLVFVTAMSLKAKWLGFKGMGLHLSSSLCFIGRFAVVAAWTWILLEELEISIVCCNGF
jgi:hypothetical protein